MKNMISKKLDITPKMLRNLTLENLFHNNWNKSYEIVGDTICDAKELDNKLQETK